MTPLHTIQPFYKNAIYHVEYGTNLQIGNLGELGKLYRDRTCEIVGAELAAHSIKQKSRAFNVMHNFGVQFIQARSCRSKEYLITQSMICHIDKTRIQDGTVYQVNAELPHQTCGS